MTTPTSRTMNHYRRLGYSIGIVERWIAQRGIRKDLFGCIDLVAIKAGEPAVGIQATSASNVSARINKAIAIPELRVWLATGARFIVIGWALRDDRWHPRIEELRLGDLGELALPIPLATLPRNRRRDRHRPGDLFAGMGE